MFERILVPLDGSESGEAVLPHLTRFLQQPGANITFLRVYPAPPGDAWMDAPLPAVAREREAAQRYVDELARRLSGRSARLHGRAVQGMPPAQAILNYAERERMTLIAMSTHGRSGMSRWLMGSVAEKVTHASRVPVFLARAFPRPIEKTVRRILIPTDGSATSLAAAGPAAKLARLTHAEVVVLHVLTPYVPPSSILPGMDAGAPLVEPTAYPPPSHDDPATAKMARRLERAGVKTLRVTVLGDPATEILERAGALGTDVVVLSTHGRSGVSRWLLGSVAERVVRNAPVPVLVVPPGAVRKARRATA